MLPWKNLKEGYDYFEISHLPPKVAVCEKRYLINASFTPAMRGPIPPAPVPPISGCRFRARRPCRRPRTKPAKKTQAASLTKPLGSVMGLRFGPSKPGYTAFTLGPATPGR